MRLTPNINGNADLNVTGSINITGTVTGTHRGDGYQVTNLNAENLLNGFVPAARLSGTYNINVIGNVAGNVIGNLQGTVAGNVVGTVTGAASLNVLKTGDTLSGDLNWSTTGRGLTWGMNTDGASIKFYNTGDGDASSRLEFQTTDNGNEYFSWTHASGSTFESMRLTPNSSGNASLRIYGNLTVDGTANGTFSGTGTSLTLNAGNLTTGTVPSARLSGTYGINVTGNAATATQASSATNVNGGTINATTATFSGQVNVSTAGIKFPNDPYGGSGDTASITYESVSGERTRLRFRVTNDGGNNTVDDKAEFLVPDNDSLLVNGYVTLNAANYNNYAPTLSGTGATGNWAINVTGSAGSAGTVPWTGVTGKPSIVLNDGGTYGINISGNAASASSLANGATDPYYLRFRGYVSGDAGADSITGMGTYGINMSGYTDTVVHFGTGGGSSPSIQLRANYGDSLWFRVGRDSETQWDGVGSRDKLILHSGNYNSYAPTLTGGNASGTWPINISGTAGIVTSQQVITALGYTPVNPGNLTNQSGSAANFSTGSFGGDVTITKSQPTIFFNDTGDSGIELAIRVNSAEGLIIYEPEDANSEWFRIDDNSNTGYLWSSQILTANNFTSFAPTRDGVGAYGTWGINITGNAVSVSSISSAQVIAALGYTPANGSGAGLINGEQNYQDYNLKRATIIDYSLAHNALTNVSGGTTVNMELGNYVSATAVGAVTWTFANPPTGARAGSIILELTNGGAYTQYWPASVRWPAGAAPSLAAAGVDVLVFITDDGGANWRGAISMGDSR
jgi:hypothetical protein